MEAAAKELLLHIQQDLDQSEERVFTDGHFCGEECVEQYVGYLLILIRRTKFGACKWECKCKWPCSSQLIMHLTNVSFLTTHSSNSYESSQFSE
jgi:hypothetical protein